MLTLQHFRAATHFPAPSVLGSLRALALAAAALASILVGLSGCMDESAGIPAKAVDSSTAAVLRVDLEGVSVVAITESLDMMAKLAGASKSPQTVQLAGAIGLQKMNLDPVTNPSVAEFENARTSLANAGATEVYLLMGEGSEPAVRMLVRGETGRSGDIAESTSSMAKSMNEASAQSGGRQLNAAPLTTEIARGWYFVSIDAPMPLEGDSARAAELDAGLAGLGTAAVAITARMPADFDERVAHAMDDPQGLGPAAMFAAQFEDTVSRLTAVAAGVTFGDSPQLQVEGDFADEAAASGFAEQWNSLVGMMTGMMAMGAQPDQADQVAAQAAAMQTALGMSAKGRMVQMILDRAKLESILK